MKKALIYSLVILVFGLAGGALATPKYGVMTFYNILGNVTGTQGHLSAGRQVVFFRDYNTSGTVSDYTTATVEPDGTFNVSAAANLNILPLKVGTVTYHVAVVKDAQGYGAGPVDFKLSGLGFERDKAMTIAQGAGVTLSNGELVEPSPSIEVWFDNRLYQPALVTPDNPFIVTESPKLKVDITIQDRYALPGTLKDYSIVLDPGTSGSQALDLSAATASKVAAAGMTLEQLKSMSLEYAMTNALSSGQHSFLVTAHSLGTLGTISNASQTATVEVMAGPVRLIGTPITFPSPFSIDKDKMVTIQYTLSKSAAIEIILTDISGRRIKNFEFSSGSEGGSAGVNKVAWDGKTDLGPLAGNGIYVGLIVAKDEGRKLGSVKVSILD
jgi:hypothetical protein